MPVGALFCNFYMVRMALLRPPKFLFSALIVALFTVLLAVPIPATAEGPENWQVNTCEELMSRASLGERIKQYVFGTLLGTNRVSQPDITPEVERQEDGSTSVKINLGDMQEYLESQLALMQLNESLLSTRPDPRTTLEGSDPNRQARQEQLAITNDFDFVGAYWRHRKDKRSTYHNLMNVWRRGQNEAMSEEWKFSMGDLEFNVSEHDGFRKKFFTAAVEGFEAGINYHLMRMAKKHYGVNSRFFDTHVEGHGGVTWRQQGLPVQAISLKYDAENHLIRFEGARTITYDSWSDFYQKMQKDRREHNEIFGKKPNILISLLEEAQKKGVIGSVIALIKSPLRAFYGVVSFVFKKGWQLLTNLLRGNIVQIFQGTGEWFMAHFSQGGRLVAISNRQAFLRKRLEKTLKVLERRETLLEIPLNDRERKLKEDTRASLVNPANAATVQSVSFAEAIILKDEVRVSTIDGNVVNGTPLPADNFDRFSNNDFSIIAENVESAEDTRVNEKLQAIKGSIIGTLTTVVGIGAITGGVMFTDLGFVIHDHPQVAYWKARAYNYRNELYLDWFGTTPEMHNASIAAERGWTLTEVVPSTVKQRLEVFVEEVRLNGEDPSYFFGDEFEAEVMNVLNGEVLAIREERNVAISFTQIRKIFLEKAIPMQIIDHMRNAFLEEYPEQGQQINAVFDGFIEYEFDQMFGANSVIETMNQNPMPLPLYADLRWFFLQGYASAYNHYLSENYGTLYTETGGPYESFGSSPSLIYRIPKDIQIYSHPGSDERFHLYKLEREREIMVIKEVSGTEFSQVQFLDRDMPDSEATLFFVKTEDINKLQ